eukprot:sb/3472901/
MFPDVEKEVIKTVLESKRGNVEGAVADLLQLTSDSTTVNTPRVIGAGRPFIRSTTDPTRPKFNKHPPFLAPDPLNMSLSTGKSLAATVGVIVGVYGLGQVFEAVRPNNKAILTAANSVASEREKRHATEGGETTTGSTLFSRDASEASRVQAAKERNAA